MKLKINIPKSWNNLSDGQFKQLARLVYSDNTGLYFDLKCFKILTNVSWWQFYKRIKMRFLFSQIPMSELKKHFDFIYKANDRTVFPEIIKGFFAPLDRMTNLTAEEFAVADDLHIKWRETKNKESLVYLAAVLYSKTKQPRELFDKNNLPEKIKHFSKLPLDVLLCIELAYFGSKNNLVKRFPQAFPVHTKKTKNNRKHGFGKVILHMAGGKFGNHEQTKATNVFTFLEEFNDNLKLAHEKNS